MGYGYDGNGNPTGPVYDVENRMTAYSTTSYWYDPSGKRVMQAYPDGNGGTFYWIYFYGVDGRRLEEMRCDVTPGNPGPTTACNSGTGNVYFSGRMVAANGVPVVTDRLGSVRVGLGAADPTNPISWNRYAYVGGDPVNRNDPSGLIWQCDSQGNCVDTGVITTSITVNGDDDPLAEIYGGENGISPPGGDTTSLYSINNPGCGTVTFQNNAALDIPSSCWDTTLPVPSTPPVTGPPATQVTQQQCISNFYNSTLGHAVQFGSPLSLLPGWNPQWSHNLIEWGAAVSSKFGGLIGSGGMSGTTELTTLGGTITVGSSFELAVSAFLGAIEMLAPPAMGAATLADLFAHEACNLETHPEFANTAGAVGP